MRSHQPPTPYCIYERLEASTGGWSMRCLMGAELHQLHEFKPAVGECSEAVYARAAAAGEAWRLASGGASVDAPSPIDTWAQQLTQNMRNLQSDPSRLFDLTKRGF